MITTPLLIGRDGLAPVAVFDVDGDLVAVHVSAAPAQSATLAFRAAAWPVDASGVQIDIAGHPVAVNFTHSADVQQVTTHTPAQIAAELRDLLLGVPPEGGHAVHWSDALRAELSIRNAITIAKAAGSLAGWSTV